MKERTYYSKFEVSALATCRHRIELKLLYWFINLLMVFVLHIFFDLLLSYEPSRSIVELLVNCLAMVDMCLQGVLGSTGLVTLL